MNTRSYIGLVNETTREFQAVYCHYDGHPAVQGDALTRILTRTFDNDLSAMLDTLLQARSGWSILDSCTNGLPSHAGALIPGVGIAYEASSNEPLATGRLGTYFDHGIDWLYLFTGEDAATADLIVCTTDAQHSVTPVLRVPVQDMASLTSDDWTTTATNPTASAYEYAHT